MRSIVVAPHPDDEVLGVGGTLLRRQAEGASVAWVIVTSISEEHGWSSDSVSRRKREIERISDFFGFAEIFPLQYPTARLDQVPMSELVASLSGVFRSFQPEEVFVPHRSDVHTDHRVVFDVVASCSKWFRYPTIKRVLSYETLSESDFQLSPDASFRPNVFIDIEPYLNKKLEAMRTYESELGVAPFPRSLEAIQALATLRGAASGFNAAEAFELLRERVPLS